MRKQFLHPSHLYAIGVAICMYPAHIADMSLDNVSLTSQCILSDRYGYLALTFDAAENVLYYSGNYTNTISAIPLETGAKAKVVASGTGVVKGQWSLSGSLLDRRRYWGKGPDPSSHCRTTVSDLISCCGSRQTLTSPPESVFFLMRISYAGFLSDAKHCLMVASCLPIVREPASGSGCY